MISLIINHQTNDTEILKIYVPENQLLDEKET